MLVSDVIRAIRSSLSSRGPDVVLCGQSGPRVKLQLGVSLRSPVNSHITLGEPVGVQRLIQIGESELAFPGLHGDACAGHTDRIHNGLGDGFGARRCLWEHRARLGHLRDKDVGRIAVVAQPAPGGVPKPSGTSGELPIDIRPSCKTVIAPALVGEIFMLTLVQSAALLFTNNAWGSLAHAVGPAPR
jgi:hypothetical protein